MGISLECTGGGSVEGLPDYDLRQYVKTKPRRHTRTAYQKWVDGDLPGLGSFHIGLMKLYQIADSTNMRKLEESFPDWFTKKHT
jgi:hypothetical protein